MENTDFAEATGYLRVLEKKMLNSDSIDRIIDAPTAADALRLLSSSSEYDFSAIKRPEDYEDVLKAETKRVYDLCYKLSRHRIIVDIPATKYDYHNIKISVKAKYLNKDFDYLAVNITSVPYEAIKNAVLNGIIDENTLPKHIKEAILIAETAFKEAKSPQDIDISLDKHMYAYLLGLCDIAKNEYIKGYIQLSIDFYNIKTLMRVKNMQKGSRFLSDSLINGGLTDTKVFMENYDKSPDTIATNYYYKYFGNIMKGAIESYEKTGNYSQLEKMFDNALMEHLKKSKLVAFGPEIIFNYILCKENEIRQIRILASCKINNIKAETLKERLRDNYA